MTFATSTNLSPNHYNGRQGHTPIVIGIHTMEAPEAGSTAEDVARYFGNPALEASSHWCVDDNSRVRVVNDSDAAWTMPPLNDQSLNVEIAGYAAQSMTQWHDVYSAEALDIAALCCAEWCHKYGIPIRHLTDTQIRAGNKGFVGHIDVNRVYHASDHTDPGANFPWTEFLAKVTAHYDNMPQPPTGSCKPLQQALGFSQEGIDGVWGPDTDKRVMTIRWAYSDQFPNTVKYAQMAVKDPVQNGEWGTASKAYLAKAIIRVQAALTGMGYDPKVTAITRGSWNASTETAFEAARKHFHG